ncbi:MAG: DUF2127 domain-containing protein [Chlorobiaceae bacterium]|nr:DUF2127 domain-containing protein [Chlorobiaceae bacterium]
MFETAKGLLVLAAGFSLFAFVQADAQALAEQLVRQLHFNPAKHFPKIFAMLSSGLTDAHLRIFALLAGLYSALRFIEAYGLWFATSWAEWFALVSCSAYLLIEFYELAKGFSWLKIGLISLNLAIALYLAYVLKRSRTAYQLVKEGGQDDDDFLPSAFQTLCG